MLIYVYGRKSDRSIKIGKTTRKASSRRREHEGSAPGYEGLELLAAVAGKPADEQYVHRFFRRYRNSDRSQEWFEDADEIVNWINYLRQQYYCVTREDDAIPEEMERVSSELWLPNDDNCRRQRYQNDKLDLEFTSLPWKIDDEPPLTDDDYYTNPAIIEAARRVMGRIDLDPASHPAANRNVKASRYYSVSENGLAMPWAGRVWVNPPFGKWGDWGPKIASEWESGRVEQMCVLLPTRSSTALSVVGTFMPLSTRIATTFGRIPFWGPHAGSPDDGHQIVYFGTRAYEFEKEFRQMTNPIDGKAYACFITQPALAA